MLQAYLGRIGALVLLTWLVFGAIACALPVARGNYRPRRGGFGDAAVPIVVRSVHVAEATRDIVDNSMTPVPFTPNEVRRVERELRDAIEADLQRSAPFRAPRPTEAPYQLDVWVESLSMPARSSAMSIVQGAFLGVPMLLGVPYGVLGRDGDAVFHMYGPDGTTLVHEFAATARTKFAIGLYYGRNKSIGDAAAPLVAQLKDSVASDVRPILAMASVPMQYASAGASGGAIVASGPERREVSTAPTTPASSMVAAAPQPSTYVLVIGIDTYRDVAPAEGAEADARRVDLLFADTFHVPDRHRRLLLGDRATKSDIDKGLRWLAAKAKRGSRVVVYFGGHGAPDPVAGTPYVVPYDGDPDDLPGTAIAVAAIDRRLAKTAARDGLLIVDACFSGQGQRSVLAKGARPLRLVDDAMPGATVVQMSAAGGSEIASATAARDGGIFTHYLLEALGAGQADIDGDGQITLAELETWLVPRVTSAARAQSRAQTPRISTGKKLRDAADVVLGWGYATE